jgi:hypothetical protein
MSAPMKSKPFYALDDVAVRLDLTLIDIGVLLAERQISLCTPVAGLHVEYGAIENEGMPDEFAYVEEVREVNGLIDLRPQDAMAVVRAGQAVIWRLDAPVRAYCRVIGVDGLDTGLPVSRDDLGVRHDVLQQLIGEYGSGAQAAQPRIPAARGAARQHDWDGCQLEVFRLFYFEGVPETKAAVIRHAIEWFVRMGKGVPDESTLQKKLKDIWAMFAPEARKRSA